MAEQEVKYNVRLNEEDLSQQLERIRQQIDLTMGSLSYSQDGIPQASDVISGQALAALNGMPGVQMPAQPPVGSAVDQMSGGTSFLDSNAEYLRLGYNKFNQDMRKIGLISQPIDPSISSMPPSMSTGPEGFFQSASALYNPFYRGYDPNTAGAFISDYRDQAALNMSDMTSDFITSNGFMAAGAVGGAAVGGATGAVIGSTVGAFADLGFSVTARQAKERESLARAFKGIASDSFGKLSIDDARSMAGRLQDKAYSAEGFSEGYSMEYLESNVADFAQAGGFSGVSNYEEMDQVLQGVIENTRDFANKIGSTQREAAQIMAQLQQEMVATTREMDTVGTQLAYEGEVTGLGAVGVSKFGMQGVEMMRGTGVGSNVAFDMARESLMQAERLKMADPVTRQLIHEAGGTQSFALSNMEATNRIMMSGQGMLYTSGLLGGSIPGDSMQDMLGASSNYFSGDPRRMISLPAQQAQLVASLPEQMQQSMPFMNAMELVKQTNLANGDGTVNREVLTSAMMNMYGVSANQAQSFISMAQDVSANDAVSQEIGMITREISDTMAASEDVAWFGRMRAGAANFLRVDASEDLYENIIDGTSDYFERRMDRKNDTLRMGIDRQPATVRAALERIRGSKGFEAMGTGFDFGDSAKIEAKTVFDQLRQSGTYGEGDFNTFRNKFEFARGFDKSAITKGDALLAERLGSDTFSGGSVQSTRDDFALTMHYQKRREELSAKGVPRDQIETLIDTEVSQMVGGAFENVDSSIQSAVLNQMAKDGVMGMDQRELEVISRGRSLAESGMTAERMTSHGADLQETALGNVSGLLLEGAAQSRIGSLTEQGQRVLTEQITRSGAIDASQLSNAQDRDIARFISRHHGDRVASAAALYGAGGAYQLEANITQQSRELANQLGFAVPTDVGLESFAYKKLSQLAKIGSGEDLTIEGVLGNPSDVLNQLEAAGLDRNKLEGRIKGSMEIGELMEAVSESVGKVQGSHIMSNLNWEGASEPLQKFFSMQQRGVESVMDRLDSAFATINGGNAIRVVDAEKNPAR